VRKTEFTCNFYTNLWCQPTSLLVPNLVLVPEISHPWFLASKVNLSEILIWRDFGRNLAA